VQLQDLFDGYASVGIAPSVWQKTSRRGKSLHDLWSKSYPYVETITLSRPGGTALSRPAHPTDLIGMAHSPADFLAAGVADHDFSWAHATARSKKACI
jgi:hypothetical protein